VSTVNLSPSSYDPAFGQSADASVKAKIINLIASVRTLMRSTYKTNQLLSLFGKLEQRASLSVSRRRQAYANGRENEERRLTFLLSLGVVPLIVINTLIIIYELVLG